MALPARESPQGKRVSLFVTCIVDMIYPQTGMSVVQILEYLGLQVDFPEGQTCCGQPGYNAGYHHEAKQVAQQFLRAFAHAEVIVVPSGSCAAMIRHEYPTLFADDPQWLPQAQQAAAKTWELTEFIVEGLRISDLELRLPKPKTFAFHDACHGLRLLGLSDSARQLIQTTGGARLVELTECDVCCGFGGLFSVKMGEISNAMLEKKIAHINASEAETILTGDAGCLTQINGGLTRSGSEKRVCHVADVLAEGLKGKRYHASKVK